MTTHCTTFSTSTIENRKQHGRTYERQEPRSGESDCLPADTDDPSRVILAGESLAARRLRSQVERIAPYFRKALISGEAGAGKLLIAQAMHAMSAAKGSFLSRRAAAMAQSLAFDAAAPETTSLLHSAQGGTLCLEEVGEVPYGLQPALLRFVMEQAGGWSGGAGPAGALAARGGRGVRLVATTSKDLRTMSSIGQFRPDLYAQLAVVELATPALRQRREDLPLLADWIIKRLSRRTGLPAKMLHHETLAELAGRSWQGNLRELEQVLMHAAALADGPVIESRHLAPVLGRTDEQKPARTAAAPDERLQDVIHHHVVSVLTRCGGNKLRAAEVLGISRSTLYRMLDSGPGAAV